MRIAIIGPAHPLRGGIANLNEALFHELTARGHDCHIFSFSLQYPGFLFPGKSQYTDSEKPEGLEITPVINSVNPLSWGKAARKVLDFDPDLVIVRFWLPFLGPSLGSVCRKLQKKGIPVIAITDNIIPHEGKPFDKAFTRFFIKRCDAFLAMSKQVLRDLDAFDTSKPRVFSPHPVYNIFGDPVDRGVALKAIGLEEDYKYFLFFGLVRPYKGLDLLLEGFGKVHQQLPGYKVVVAGEFYEKPDRYQEIIERFGIRDKVILRDHFIPEDQVKHYFCAADLVTQTYRTATQSGVSQIAFHFERPLLVTRVGGLPEIIQEGKTGFLCDTDPEDVARALLKYDKEGLTDFNENVVKEKERFGWDYFVDNILSLKNEIKS